MNIYCYGSYGTGNLGDDAIFAGLRACLRKEYDGKARIIQIYISKQTHVNGIAEEYLLEDGFEDGDILIIGGGGLFHSKLNASNILKMAKMAKSDHMKIVMRAVGLEAVEDGWKKEVRKVIKLCNTVSLRGSSSFKVIDEMGLNNSGEFRIEEDLAYNIEPNIEAARDIFPKFTDDLPVIGIATAHNGNMIAVGEYIRHLMTDFNLLHVPHCRHYVDEENNDVAGGHLLWSNLNIHLFDRLRRYKQLVFPGEPETLLGIYHLLDGMIGYRYHSFVFCEMANLKLYAMPHGAKADGYFKDHPGLKCKKDGDSHDKLAENMKSFFRK